jgi:hypothetical protein
MFSPEDNIKINKKKKTCEIKNKVFNINEVNRVMDLLELVSDDEPVKGLVIKNDDLAWCLWGIGVLKPFKVTRRIFDGVFIRWRVGPNFDEVYDYFKYLEQSLRLASISHHQAYLVGSVPIS